MLLLKFSIQRDFWEHFEIYSRFTFSNLKRIPILSSAFSRNQEEYQDNQEMTWSFFCPKFEETPKQDWPFFGIFICVYIMLYINI